ncbi:SDR family oxidoreductase [Maritalea mediterranea]|uniref:SDR family NAD(P)-dependent oxidoreductase n=1 Tax=Maritalea mediterranea TaxID=2909667 RepID=A0ABS9E8P6_9HYPH|nr:SDR family NAD(P)-dependent oxidoreductase [Maritalea mediterranea]MCF4097831.1 SDR family NAD(P)-dependent oxidoreductase [Maritalea mediterranea]
MGFDFSGCKALVTGGARGIGLEISKLLIARGAQLIVVGRNEDDLRRLQQQFPQAVTPYASDLAEAKAVDQLIEHLLTNHPDLNVLINNAARQVEMNVLAGDAPRNIADGRDEIALNLDALISLSLGLLPQFARQERALICNISTGLAIAPKAASPVYCATKAWVRHFTRAIRYQCEDEAPQVQISEAVMALVDTEMTRGRGTGKISPQQAALEVVNGLAKGRNEIWVGKAKLLRFLNLLAPPIAARILR